MLYNYPYIPKEQQAIRDEIRQIERDANSLEYSIKAVPITDMPHITETSDPVYNLYTSLQHMLDRYTSQIEQLRQKYDSLEHEREVVEKLLDSLGVKEAKVVRAVYFKGVRRWETIGRDTHYSERQCRYIHQTSFAKMLQTLP